ncbi:MAG: RNA-directed DNA polymerase [Planctomycetes bacterium]|nr:RNA-directed DNA polymerase [Planctomycetota bacterium]
MNEIRHTKSDKFRALLTDTSNGDIPLIFSNDGFYLNCTDFDRPDGISLSLILSSIFSQVLDGGNSQSNPFKYSIKKNEIDLRTLSLIHPRAQLLFCDFYRKYANLLVYCCSQSPASIRAPERIRDSFHTSTKNNLLANEVVRQGEKESKRLAKDRRPFFQYRGFGRFYQFFNSTIYLSLEKRFPSFWELDVANCFGSIYTHTISWAIKHKEYVKSHIRYNNQFCAEFDRLMQRSNNNETNGIPIGSEISRIFSEVIFQAVDCDVIDYLYKHHALRYDLDYVFLRYVDDYLIFSNNENQSKVIAAAISDQLRNYNLYLNENKLRKHQRPFCTLKSSVITQLGRIFEDLEEKFFDVKLVDDKKQFQPKKIHRTDSALKYFVDQVKSTCEINSCGYPDVSSYLIAVLSNRILKLIKSFQIELKSGVEFNGFDYCKLLVVLFKIVFFFYKVNPQITASYKVASTVLFVDDFLRKEALEFTNYFRTIIMEEVDGLAIGPVTEKGRTGVVLLEELNILLATSNFGENYLVSEKRLSTLFEIEERASYFTIISVLYYIRERRKYSNLRITIETEIRSQLSDNNNIATNSESAHLFLDSLSCPYLSFDLRKDILSNYLTRYEPNWNPSSFEIDNMLDELKAVNWFVNWEDRELIDVVERRVLASSY